MGGIAYIPGIHPQIELVICGVSQRTSSYTTSSSSVSLLTEDFLCTVRPHALWVSVGADEFLFDQSARHAFTFAPQGPETDTACSPDRRSTRRGGQQSACVGHPGSPRSQQLSYCQEKLRTGLRVSILQPAAFRTGIEGFAPPPPSPPPHTHNSVPPSAYSGPDVD